MEKNLQLALVEPDSDTVHEALGIPQDRYEELCKAMEEALSQYPKYSSAAAKVSGMCNHANELYMVGVLAGAWSILKNGPLGGVIGISIQRLEHDEDDD